MVASGIRITRPDGGAEAVGEICAHRWWCVSGHREIPGKHVHDLAPLLSSARESPADARGRTMLAAT